MPIDPITGQANYGSMPGMPDPNQVSAPFIFEAAEFLPGVTTTTMINAGRYSNTLMRRW